ncbi:MAG: helix-turn-helix domain-containing protein [Opitutaceae bacterium]|nr:helix-turn-helix domain-containing protein [Opitutaceae bacterium]
MKLLINGIGTYGAGSRIGPARWAHHDLIVLLEGHLHLVSGGETLALYAHDAVFIPPGTDFVGTISDPGGVTWVQHFAATPAELPPVIPRRGRPGILRAVAGSEVVLALLRRLHVLRERTGDDALRLALFRALLLELAEAPQPRGAKPDEAARLQPAITWAERNLAQASSLQAVARQAGMSESHFRSLFRRHRGQAAGAWLRERRMSEARRLLSSTDLSLKETSAAVGFSDVVSFNRSFRQFHGLPPGRFRQANPRAV